LTLRRVRVHTLTALASAPSLTHLTLVECTDITFDHVCQLSACVNLRHLRIEFALDSNYDRLPWYCLIESQQSELRVPSSRLPALESFEYVNLAVGM
jgi:hypothetical protein